MAEWKKLTFNSNCVEVQTPNSFLIKIPKSEFRFWHPAKLVRFSGKNNYLVSISYTDDFTFKFFRNGKGKYNKYDKIEDCELSAKYFVSRFFSKESFDDDEE